jgi:hypothetical protein
MPASGASEKVMFRLVVTDRSEPGRRWAGAGVAWFGQIAAGLTAPVGTVVAGFVTTVSTVPSKRSKADGSAATATSRLAPSAFRSSQ